ncbi:hypothetical protein B484DRAFT_232997 [Ochromonadaceae sp. CCMP2298]|nr:hypothetical protein B484DRAFT_232997 [Ochromonadaceae sp. CCMP2298]
MIPWTKSALFTFYTLTAFLKPFNLMFFIRSTDASQGGVICSAEGTKLYLRCIRWPILSLSSHHSNHCIIIITFFTILLFYDLIILYDHLFIAPGGQPSSNHYSIIITILIILYNLI